MSEVKKLLLKYGYIENFSEEENHLLKNESLNLMKNINIYRNETNRIKADIKKLENKSINKIMNLLNSNVVGRLSEAKKTEIDSVVKKLKNGEILAIKGLNELRDIEKNLESIINEQIKEENKIIEDIKRELDKDEYDIIKFYINDDKFRKIISLKKL